MHLTKQILSVWMASIGALVTMSTVLAAPPTYTATRIVGPAGTAVNGTANNRAGDIVGWTAPLGTNLGRPFLFSGGARIDFEALGGPTGFAGDINDAGAIVGVADIPSGVDHAFVRSNGVVRDIHPAGARSSFAQAINDAGAIVGGYVDAAGIFQGFLLQGTALTTLPTLGGNTTLANSINEAGIVVGYSRNAQNQTRPFRYSGGTMTDLGTFGGNNGVALGINERGDIVGYAESAGSPARGFLYSNGALTPLGTLGGNTSTALDINDSGTIVGESAVAASGNRAFIFTENAMTDLNSLVVSGLNGAVLTSAVSINVSGQIVALACPTTLSCATFKLDPLTPGKTRAIEYYHEGFDHYFLTTIPDEITKLDNGTFVGWRRTGERVDVDGSVVAGTVSVCRFFSAAFAPKSSHFYTPYAAECDTVKRDPVWTFEGDVFRIALPDGIGGCSAGRVPLYRVYNNGMGGAPNHRYTTSLGIRQAMVALGWTAEGFGPQITFACV